MAIARGPSDCINLSMLPVVDNVAPDFHFVLILLEEPRNANDNMFALQILGANSLQLTERRKINAFKQIIFLGLLIGHI